MPSKKPTAMVDSARMQGKAPKAIPVPFEDVLPSGRIQKWRMPDPLKLIAFDGVLPDALTASVIRLLDEEKARTPDVDPRKFRYDAQAIAGLYKLYGAMAVDPPMDPELDYGDGSTLGRCDVGYMDIVQMYWLWRLGPYTRVAEPTSSEQPEGAADAPSDS